MNVSMNVYSLTNDVCLVWKRAGEWNDYYLLHDHKGVDPTMPTVVMNTMHGKEIEQVII